MKKFEGKCGISATVICDSISSITGTRITTFEIEYPRIIHSELMTHRMLSRNAASSRAIPFTKMVEQLNGRPVRFGANISGMQDNGEHDGLIEGKEYRFPHDDSYWPAYDAEQAWEEAKQDAIFWSTAFHDAGYHKQVFNRLTECFQMMKTIVTATEFSNFFYLRNDTAADPTLQELAKTMLEAYNDSTPARLEPGEWHLPFVYYDSLTYYILDEHGNEYPLDLDDAIKVSCARCAAVSFRNLDYDLNKCIEVYDRLVNSGKLHGSALEHCASPMEKQKWETEDERGINEPWFPFTWQRGISHLDRDNVFWSGNFKNWIQYRKIIPNENYTG